MSTEMVTLLIATFIYFLPWLVALGRNHNNALAIFMLNLLLGATVLGWIWALIWACTNNVERRE